MALYRGEEFLYRSATIGGVTKTWAEWCEERGIDRETVKNRMRSGNSFESALIKPPKDGHCWEKRRGDGVRIASKALGILLTFDAIAVAAVLMMHGNAWPLIALYWVTLSVVRILDWIGEAR